MSDEADMGFAGLRRVAEAIEGLDSPLERMSKARFAQEVAMRCAAAMCGEQVVPNDTGGTSFGAAIPERVIKISAEIGKGLANELRDFH